MSAPEKAKGFLGEFKTFIARGNVMDMAVGVIIGGAFKSIADSLVNDIINPILGIFTGGYSDLSGLVISLPLGGDLMIGNFINAILNFLIMAFVVFCIIKTLNNFHDKTKKQEEAPAAPAAPPEPTNEEKLLMEIRDLLKTQK